MTRRRRSLDGLDEDIRDHLERETQDNIDRGMTPDEARAAAVRAFGNVTIARWKTRSAVWIPVWFDQLMQDARYGLRMLPARARLQRRRDPDARARHRPEHRRVQRRSTPCWSGRWHIRMRIAGTG